MGSRTGVMRWKRSIMPYVADAPHNALRDTAHFMRKKLFLKRNTARSQSASGCYAAFGPPICS